LFAGCQESVDLKAAKDAFLSIENYKEARKIFWGELYNNGGETLYCQQPFSRGNRSGLNVEHVFPMSWVTNGLNCGTRKQCRRNSATFNRIEADLHNLYPSRTDVNQDRSSFRFAEIRGEDRRYGKQCDFEVDERARSAEPANAVRGEVARAMFYMAHRYKEHGLVIFESSGRLLHKWHKLDPPNKSEIARNDKIAQIQGSRNPFVDDPESLSILVKQGYFF
jgi:deoxyribonuclease-1